MIVSPLERLAEVRRFEISHIPLQLLLKGLLGEGEAGYLALHPQLTHKQWECCKRLSRSGSNHHHCFLTHTHCLLLHLLIKPFGHQLGWLLRELQILMKAAWIILAYVSWAWASFLTISHQSFSTSVAILAMEAFALRFLWSATAAACFSSFVFYWFAFLSRPCHGRPSQQFPEPS